MDIYREIKETFRKVGASGMLSVVAAGIALSIATSIQLKEFLSDDMGQKGSIEEIISMLDERNIVLENRIKESELELQRFKQLVKQQQDNLVLPIINESGNPKDIAALRKTIIKLNSDLESIRSVELSEMQNQLDGIEDVIMEDPVKALSLPLIEKDIQLLREGSKTEITGLKSDIGRVYDQNKWFIGLMFTMAIGLLGLAVSNVIQARKLE